jgi:hypothetical protein
MLDWAFSYNNFKIYIQNSKLETGFIILVLALLNLKFNLQLDVFGLCPTDFSFSERGGTTTITKSRNLNKCQLREHLRQDFASVTYNVDSVSIYSFIYIK